MITRGFTGHEHFFDVGLLHMNGRMYDSKLGRFLSPDNYIQEPIISANNSKQVNGEPRSVSTHDFHHMNDKQIDMLQDILKNTLVLIGTLHTWTRKALLKHSIQDIKDNNNYYTYENSNYLFKHIVKPVVHFK